MYVYSNFEINFRGFQHQETTEAQDAIELLQMFSFFHRENIRVEFLTRIATNPTIELEEQEEEQAGKKTMTACTRIKSWRGSCKALMLVFADLIYKERTPPVLPHRFPDDSEFERLGGISTLGSSERTHAAVSNDCKRSE